MAPAIPSVFASTTANAQMKKPFLLILLSLAFVQCEKEEPEVGQDKAANIQLTVAVDESYLYVDSYESETGHVYLADGDGKVIAWEELKNGITVALQNKEPGHTYSLTFSRRLDVDGYKLFTIDTYLDIHSGSLFLNRSAGFTNKEATFDLLNTGGALEDLNFDSNSYSYSSTTANGGEANYNFDLRSDPDNVFMSFKRNFEESRRYVWVENVTSGSTFTFDCDTLPKITSPVSIHFPENDYLWTTIEGVKDAYPAIRHRVSNQLVNTGTSVSAHYIPEGLFDRFISKAFFKANQKTYRIEKEGTSVVEEFKIPALNFEIGDKSISNFQMSSSSDFDVFTLSFRYEGADENYNILWRFYGGKREEIRFAVPQIIGLILSELPGASQRNFVFKEARIQRQEGIDSFEDYLDTRFGDTSTKVSQGLGFESVSQN